MQGEEKHKSIWEPAGCFMSKRCKLGLILPLFINCQKKEIFYLRRQTAAPSEGAGRTSRGTVHSDMVRNAVAMVHGNIICLFPVDNLKWLWKVRNHCLKAPDWRRLHEIISLQESTKDPKSFLMLLSRVERNVHPGKSSPPLSCFAVYHLWVHLDPLLLPIFVRFRLFFIPFPVRQDRSDEELDGWQVVLTLQGSLSTGVKNVWTPGTPRQFWNES